VIVLQLLHNVQGGTLSQKSSRYFTRYALACSKWGE